MFLMIQVDLPSSQEEVWVWLLESSELERIQDCFRFSKAVAFCCFVKGGVLQHDHAVYQGMGYAHMFAFI